MTEIQVDFNSRAAYGRVRGSLRRAGDVNVGDTVVLVDVDEDMQFEAVVAVVDRQRGRVDYEVDWVRADEPAVTGVATRGYKPARELDVKLFVPSLGGAFVPSSNAFVPTSRGVTRSTKAATSGARV